MFITDIDAAVCWDRALENHVILGMGEYVFGDHLKQYKLSMLY